MSWQLNMILRMAPVLLPVYLYCGWRVSSALIQLFGFSPGWTRSITAAGILFVNLLPLAILYRSRSGELSRLILFQPSLQSADFWLNFPFWFALVIAVESVLYLIGLDLLGGLFRLIPAWRPQNWLSLKSAFVLGIVLFFTIFAVYRVYRDSYQVQLRPYQIPVKNLASELADLRLTFVSDVQVDRYSGETKLQHYRQQVAAAGGDLILFGGDLVTSGEDFIDPALDLMGRHQAPLGKIACLGDHDFWANPGRIAGGLRAAGWDFLDNAHQLIDYRGKRILVTGVTYIYSRRISEADLRELLERAPEADLRILLVHQPAGMVVRLAEEYGYDLLLAGHTHGGQLVFRPFGLTLTPTRLENQFYSGRYQFGRMAVLVTNGVGLTLAPFRYRAPAEVMRVEFARMEDE